jgi:Rrf2 family protein
MKVSTKCRYGLRAMLYLAKHGNNGPVKRRDISKKEDIPSPYLENILVSLRKAGLIRTMRGASGGYVLSKGPDKIKLLEVFETLEGSAAPIECVINETFCTKTKSCEAFILWSSIYKAQKEILETMTLSDLVNSRRQEWVI